MREFLQWMAVSSLGDHPPFVGLFFNPKGMSTDPPPQASHGVLPVDDSKGCTLSDYVVPVAGDP